LKFYKKDEMLMKKKVLFLCTHNSCRSQMAEAILRHNLGDQYEAFSAGTEKTKVPDPVIKVLSEIGIDTSNLYSKTTDIFQDTEFDYVVTVCDNAKEACPFFPGAKNIIHRNFIDPSGNDVSGKKKIESFRKTRDEISEWIMQMFG
jgi:arsenate reductase (thioredoxin)